MYIQLKKGIILAIFTLFLGSLASTASADHSWGNYHWGRTSNPFTLELGDNVSSAWDGYLATTAGDWSLSSVLDTVVKPGKTKPSQCRATNGRVEVCSNKYGFNGWLGLAQIWVSSSHITKGAVKVNDTYFNTSTYNKPEWRNLVMCQEVGHTLGLDHQDEDFNNANLGTCMDYTSDPSSNQHPNQHDYDQLESIYTHLDSVNTVIASTDDAGGGKGRRGRGSIRDNLGDQLRSRLEDLGNLGDLGQDLDLDNPSEWGRVIRQDARGRSSLHVRDLSGGEKVFTFVIWVQ